MTRNHNPQRTHMTRDARFANRNVANIVLRETLYAQMTPDEQRAMRVRAIMRHVERDANDE